MNIFCNKNFSLFRNEVHEKSLCEKWTVKIQSNTFTKTYIEEIKTAENISKVGFNVEGLFIADISILL